jgi:hypothetical protein
VCTCGIVPQQRRLLWAGRPFFVGEQKSSEVAHCFLKLITEKRFQNYTIQKFP